MGSRTKRPALSKGLLEMKFMQRSRVRREQEDIAEAQRELQEKFLPSTSVSSASALNPTTSVKLVAEPSYAVVADLKFGRMSFRGFNPEVEKIMAHLASLREDVEEEKKKVTEKRKEFDVSDEEMVERFGTVSQTINSKFSRRRGNKTGRSRDLPIAEEEPKQKRFRKPK